MHSDQSLGGKLGLICEPKTRESVTLKPFVISHISKEKTSIPEAMEKPTSVRKTKQERKHGENSGMSLELPLTFEAKTKNSTTGEMISSSASESREKEPIFYNFMPIPEIDRPQISKEYVFATKTHDGSEEVSTEPFVYGSCITIMVLASPKRGKQLKTWLISLTLCHLQLLKPKE